MNKLNNRDLIEHLMELGKIQKRHNRRVTLFLILGYLAGLVHGAAIFMLIKDLI